MRLTINHKLWSLLLGLSLLVSLASPIKAQSIQQLGPNYFVAGIPSPEFDFFVAPEQNGRQRQANWCWAACVQMVLNYHGLYVTQEQVVARIYGNLVDQPAGDQQVRTALSGWAPNVSGGVSQIFCQGGLSSVNDITNNVAFKWPLIVGLRNPQGGVGHAYVLTAIYYATDQFNNTIPDKVVLRDPWPSNPSRIEVPWQEFAQRLQMAYKVWVSR